MGGISIGTFSCHVQCGASFMSPLLLSQTNTFGFDKVKKQGRCLDIQKYQDWDALGSRENGTSL